MLYRRVAGIAGILGPALFTTAWIVAAATLPGYSSRAEDISDLAAPTSDQPAIAIMTAGFFALGLALLALAHGLWREAKRTGRRSVVPALLLVVGVAVFLLGVFRSDCSEVEETCRQRVDAGEVSTAHYVHNALTVVAFPLATLAPAVLAWELHRAGRWSGFAAYSAATAVVTAALLVLFLTEIAGSWNGGVQRLFVSVPLLWVAVLGGRLLRRGAAGRPTPG